MPEYKNIQCLVIDDEPPARELLVRYINQVPSLTFQSEASNALQALSILQKQQIELMFLDINLPQLSGIDFLKTIKHPPKVILTTAYPEFALEGYDLDVVDYLLKPIPFERFLKAVNKAFEIISHRPESGHIPEERNPDSFVYFRADRKMVKVVLQDIMYVESMKDYVKVFTRHGMIVTKQSMSSVEAMLPEKEFLRTHRSFLVSVAHISSFTTELIEIGKVEIPIGKLYRQLVLKQLES